MQAVKLTILGSFWDVQVYAGRLHLFGLNGELVNVDWNRAVRSLNIPHELRPVSEVSLINSSLFYESGARMLVNDPEIKPVIIEKFRRLSELDLIIEDPTTHSFITDNPFPFPHTDSDVHYRTLFVGSDEGLHTASVYESRRQSAREPSVRRWDGPVFGLSTSHRTVALAAGEDGLFEQPVSELRPSGDPKLVASNNCTDCDWTYYSIYGSSHTQPGFLAEFEKVKREEKSQRPDKPVRKLDRVLSSDDLFSAVSPGSFSWGIGDKIYLYQAGLIDVIRYRPRAKNKDSSFEPIGQIPLESWKGDVVSASAAPFGTVVECDHALIVLASNDKSFTIEGEPVNWRVYNKSNNYRNQLHIVYEDRIDIWSFDQDYFVDQSAKLVGTTVN